MAGTLNMNIFWEKFVESFHMHQRKIAKKKIQNLNLFNIFFKFPKIGEREQYTVTINVPLFKKLWGIIFFFAGQ